MPGCKLYVSYEFGLVNLPIANGRATWILPIPNNFSLAGGMFYVQGVVLASGG